MRYFVKSISAMAWVALVGAGCGSSGLSEHETASQNYPLMMYASPQVVNAKDVVIKFPLNVAVAQIGEVAPPQSLLDVLRKHDELFHRISSLSGISTMPDPHGPDQTPANSAQEQLQRMRFQAEGLRADYLLIFGGNVDHGEQGNGLQLLDLTIVGAFIVPSHAISVSGRAAGSLIDAHTGQVVMNFNAESKGVGMAASAFAQNVQSAAVMKNREELINKLGVDIIRQLGDEKAGK